MEVTRTEKYRNRPVSKLSGGQRQRVWIAMALAQDTELLLLDEPTTYLDVRYQIQILQLVRRLNEEYGLTIVMVLHDINQALYYSDEILAMKEGKNDWTGSSGGNFDGRTVRRNLWRQTAGFLRMGKKSRLYWRCKICMSEKDGVF